MQKGNMKGQLDKNIDYTDLLSKYKMLLMKK